MHIEMYADVVCPWSYVGKRQLDRALAQYGHRASATAVEVTWRPFLIDPAAPRPSMALDEAWADPGIRAELDRCAPGASGPPCAGAPLRAGESADGPKPRSAQVLGRRAEEVAAELGIGPGWSPRWRANSWAAQRLITSAADRGWAVQGAVAEALLAAHFVAGEDLGLVDVIGRVAEEFGLPAPLSSDGRSALAYMEPGGTDGLERETREAYLTGLAIGVRTSPTFVVDGVVIARGAQPPSVLVEALERAAGSPQRWRADDELVRLRRAEALTEAGNPYGALYLLEGLRPAHDGDRLVETAAARALLAAANLAAAREKLAPLLEMHPYDLELHWLMGRTLRRLGDPAATAHLAMAGALDV